MSSAYAVLVERLAALRSVLVAYSGGVDSTLLAVAARDALGDRCQAVLATGHIRSANETDRAREVARRLQLDLIEIETHELSNPHFTANTPDRCYWCKFELFSILRRIAEAHGLAFVADGSNADDALDHRPGGRAAAELGIVSPLQDAGMTKAAVREAARSIGLPNWDQPSMACLATRFPYGEKITRPGILRVSAAEDALRGLGFLQVRVRSHGDVARIEIAPEELDRAWRVRDAVAAAGHDAGFAYVALDVDGYRTGSMNEVLRSQ